MNIPITHDETATVVHYYNYSFWDIMMYPDAWPNNHILNTLSTKVFINIFGKDQFVVRLPNLLSFIVYCFGVFRILKTLLSTNHLFFVGGALLFFANSYLLDFFSLCRGYGMSAAFVTLSMSYLLSGYKLVMVRHIWIAFILSFFASYANFTSLVFWSTTVSICFTYFCIVQKVGRIKACSILILTTIAYLLLIYNPIRKMTSTDQFQYWTSEGFYNETIISLVEHWKYNADLPFGLTSKFIGFAVIVFAGLSALYIGKILWKSYDKRAEFRRPEVLLFLLLFGTSLVTIVQTAILNTPNLNGRTALFFYPLFIAFLISICRKALNRFNVKGIGFVSLVVAFLLVYHLSSTYSMTSVREWWYDENTLAVLDYLKEQHPDETVPLSVNWHFHRSFFFYTETGKTPWLDLAEYDKELSRNKAKEYVYVMESDLVLFDDGYERIQKFGWDRWLLKKVD